MVRFATLVLALALSLAAPLNAQAVPQTIVQMRAEIAALHDDLAEAAGDGTARARLSRAFIEGDITFSRRHLDNWGTLLQDRWTQHLLFFDTQAAALDNWDRALGAGLVTQAEADAALSQVMPRVRALASAMPLWHEDDVQRFVERAFWTDLAHEIGCCDALYYLALEEAAAVWSDAQSPDSSAIAALEVFPMVPTGRVAPIGPSARAYHWLASRAETLALEVDAAPGARRALLVEASLLEDLFGLPAGQPEARSLATLAARHGFAARPAAPLFRMAALTDSRHLQVDLLTRAQDRLEARADHLRHERAVLSHDEGDALDRTMRPGVAPVGATQTAASGHTPIAARDPGPSTPSAPDERAAAQIEDILSGLRDPQLDLAGLVALADLAQQADAVFDDPDALDILQTLDDDPLSDTQRSRP